MSDELKPCPFCGSTEVLTIWDGNAASITCACSGTGPYAWLDERMESEGRHAEVTAEAAQMWNTRPVEDELRAKWESVPWEDLWIALECSMVEEYLCHPHDGKHVAIAKTWFAANAPKEAAE